MRWSWHLTDLDLGNPEWWDAWNGCKVMQEMRMQWRVGDDSPWGGWASSPLYLLWSQPLCPPEISYDETLILMVMVTLSGAFVRWWRYKGGASSMRYECFYIEETHRAPEPSPVWGYSKKCMTKKDPAWPHCGNSFSLFLSLWYIVIATQKD